MHHRVKFHADWSNRFVDMAIYRHLGFLTVFRDCGSLLLVYCILKNSRFCLLSRFGGQMYVIVPNFALIGQTVSEIWLFFDFSRWRPSAILNFVKIRNFNFRSGSEAQYASPCQITCRSAKSFQRYKGQCSARITGGLGGPGPLSSSSAPDPHYWLVLRARHKAP